MADSTKKTPDKAPVAAETPRAQPLETFYLDAVLASGQSESVGGLSSGGGGESRSPVQVGAPLSLGKRLVPFALKFASDVGGGGSWIIWLPGSTLLVVDGRPVELAPAADAVGSPYPAGWYRLACITTTPASLYLNLHVDDDTGAVRASFNTSRDTAATGESVWSVLIAQITTRQIVQCVSSALVLRINVYYV